VKYAYSPVPSTIVSISFSAIASNETVPFSSVGSPPDPHSRLVNEGIQALAGKLSVHTVLYAKLYGEI
jgi:hypothetical protein